MQIVKFVFGLLIFMPSRTVVSSEEVSKGPALRVEAMQQEIKNLGADTNFTFVDLGIASGDLRLINEFKIESTGQYDRYGDLELIKSELPEFLRSVGTNDERLIQKVTETVFSVASDVVKASDSETAWVAVRTFTPSHGFDIPRWHYDGYYFAPYDGFAFKFATVLKGNPTIFYQLPKDLRETFVLHSRDRMFLSNLLEKSSIEAPNLGQGAFFVVGDMDSAAVHSEPKIDGERLFFSVLPGSKDQIDDLNARWNP